MRWKYVNHISNNLKLIDSTSASSSLKHIFKEINKQQDNLEFNYTTEGIPLIE